MPEKLIENSVFTLKTHQMFSLHTTPEKVFQNNNPRGHFGLLFEENSYRAVAVSKSSVFKSLFIIFPYLNCFDLFETNVTQSIGPINSVYHARLVTSRSHYAREV